MSSAKKKKINLFEIILHVHLILHYDFTNSAIETRCQSKHSNTNMTTKKVHKHAAFGVKQVKEDLGL